MMRVFRRSSASLRCLRRPARLGGGRFFQIVFRRPPTRCSRRRPCRIAPRSTLRTLARGSICSACVVSGEMRVDRNGVIGDLVDLAARCAAAPRPERRGPRATCSPPWTSRKLSPRSWATPTGVPAEVRLYRLARARVPSCHSAASGSPGGRLPAIAADGVLQGGELPRARVVTPVGSVRGLAPRTKGLLGSGSAWGRRLIDRLPASMRALAAGLPARLRASRACLNRCRRRARAGAASPQRSRPGAIDRARPGAARLPRRAPRADHARTRRSGSSRGPIQEARGSFGPAADGYAKAGKNGERRGLKQLVRMTQSKSCAARTNAARRLGALGTRGVAGLRKLEQGRSPTSARTTAVPLQQQARARDALGQLQARSGNRPT